ncbi:hypothetical protein QYZ87_03590 [Porphyromonadaceae bacterium W3.11]|nr:hypothetical protein [Porphyromonadaceae bacterium W3.11]
MKEKLTKLEISTLIGGNGNIRGEKKVKIIIINGKKYVITPTGQMIPLELY